MSQISSLKRNLIYNVMGLVIPLALAVISTPFLIKQLGIEQFGLLTLIWSVMGYFGFLDFGISRALTNAVAVSRAKNNLVAAWENIWTAVLVLTVLSLFLALLLYTFNADIVQHMHISPELQARSIGCLSWVALSLPIVILNGVQKGALEGYERFDLVNKIRLPMALWSYVGPLCLMPFTRNIEHVVIFLIGGRLITVALFAITLSRVYVAGSLFSASALRGLLTNGGWIGLSSVMSPVMIYIDRFVIAAKVLLNQVAYYTTPMDAITKLLQPIDAIAGVLFPALSRAYATDKAQFDYLYRLGSEIINTLMFVGCATLITFAHPLLSLWINGAFADQAALIFQILALGVYANALARSPWGVLQASQRAAYTALIQLCELIPYFALLWLLSDKFGILGAAIAWTARVTIDAAVLFYKAGDKYINQYILGSWICLLVLLMINVYYITTLAVVLGVYVLAMLHIIYKALFGSKTITLDRIALLFNKKIMVSK